MTGDEITSIYGSLQFSFKPDKRVLKLSWGLELNFPFDENVYKNF